MARASARHILVDTEELCLELKQRITNGEKFSDLAEQYSTCSSAEQGGALGSFKKGVMVPEFDDVVFTATVGEVQGPVQTQFGYHLIEVTMRA